MRNHALHRDPAHRDAARELAAIAEPLPLPGRCAHSTALPDGAPPQPSAGARRRIMIVMVLSALDGQRSLGGVDSACQAQLQGLLEMGDSGSDIIIVAFNPASDLVTDACEIVLAPHIRLFWHNYRRKTGPHGRLPNVVRNELLIRRLIKTLTPDIVHSHLPQWHIRKCGAERKILTLHQYGNIGRTPVSLLNDLLHRDIIEPASIRNSDAVTCVSREVSEMVGARRKGAVHHIPNAINPRFFGLDRTPRNEGPINLLIAGTLSRAKGVMDALEVVRRLKTAHPEIRLTLAGRPSADEAFNRQMLAFIADHRLQETVKFAGVLGLPAMLERMRDTHIGLFLSEQETFGLAGLECLAAGIPLVTTRVGVFKWQCDDFTRRGVDVVTIGDVGAAAQAVSRRIADRAYSAQRPLTDYLAQNFSRTACAAKYLEIYDAV
jgi:glycosyltransferase involved in cell wall biosynthesis